MNQDFVGMVRRGGPCYELWIGKPKAFATGRYDLARQLFDRVSGGDEFIGFPTSGRP
jgi:hypothetical protein